MGQSVHSTVIPNEAWLSGAHGQTLLENPNDMSALEMLPDDFALERPQARLEIARSESAIRCGSHSPAVTSLVPVSSISGCSNGVERATNDWRPLFSIEQEY